MPRLAAAAVSRIGRRRCSVAILGILALIGIIIRNSVILVTQIDAYERDGYTPWDAVVEATEHRRRPILLIGFAFKIAQDLLGPASLVFGFSPLFAVLLPAGICALAGIWLLRRAG